MDTYRCFIVLAVLTQDFVTTAGRAGVCTFPEKWLGRWHMNAVGNMGFVNIKNTSIDRIGDCVGKKGRDRFLIHDAEKSCHMCIIAIERDHNVIQYRKGDCVAQDNELPNMSYICKQVKVEHQMITLVRAGVDPIECPLGRLRKISYDNNTGTYCHSPKSELQTCASNTKMRLQFGQCEDVPGTHETELMAECLGEWKDGSKRFIYTSIANSQQGAMVFRCFKYNEHGTEINAEMSTDASCRFHMKITLHEEAILDPTCKFPTWIQFASWMDISGKAIYNVQNGGRELYAKRLKDNGVPGRTTHRFSCLKRMDGNQSEVYITVRSIHKCSSSFQCLKLEKNTDGIIQMTESSKSRAEPHDCMDYLSQRKHVHNVAILVRDTEQEDCPITGAFKAGECTSHPVYAPMTSLHIGCREKFTFMVYSEREDNKIFDSYRCLKKWRKDGKLFIIARDKKTNAFTCLVHGNLNGQESLIRNDNCEITNGQICKVDESRDSCYGRGRHRKIFQEEGPDGRAEDTGYSSDNDVSSNKESSATIIMYSYHTSILYVLIMAATNLGTWLDLLVC